MNLRVDRNALRFNQASIITLTVLAFVLAEPAGRWLVLAIAVVMAVGTVYAPLSAFKLLYRYAAVRLGLLRPAVFPEDPAPHQFAQGMGSAFLFAAFLALVVDAALLGWTLAWVVVALAAVNLIFGFCVGCFLYFQLGRLGTLPRAERAG